MKKHISNTKILFVLTNISSLKILQQKVGINKISNLSNVFVERKTNSNILFNLLQQPFMV
mgnify:CR=1 FL=1